MERGKKQKRNPQNLGACESEIFHSMPSELYTWTLYCFHVI